MTEILPNFALFFAVAYVTPGKPLLIRLHIRQCCRNISMEQCLEGLGQMRHVACKLQ